MFYNELKLLDHMLSLSTQLSGDLQCCRLLGQEQGHLTSRYHPAAQVLRKRADAQTGHPPPHQNR